MFYPSRYSRTCFSKIGFQSCAFFLRLTICEGRQKKLCVLWILKKLKLSVKHGEITLVNILHLNQKLSVPRLVDLDIFKVRPTIISVSNVAVISQERKKSELNKVDNSK